MAALTDADDQRSFFMKRFIAISLISSAPKNKYQNIIFTYSRLSLRLELSLPQFSRFLIKKICSAKPFLYRSNPVPSCQALSMSKAETEISLLRQDSKATAQRLAKPSSNPLCTPLRPVVSQLGNFDTSDWTAGKISKGWEHFVKRTASGFVIHQNRQVRLTVIVRMRLSVSLGL
ncbi:hypothetical protein AVEN_186913-1 [Araneus ventricosus]|uniref:Uncharacterized protein n=1 Tax=Araneus ventricosus TaxID=182803 RepID=A0A4Y2L6E4_ARAVE|nr:hypothetical protein AVEN_186913-1 [Araneus ventricosus]